LFVHRAAGTAGSSGGEGVQGGCWRMLGLILLLFMPLRAFGALHEEIKGKTLELLFLTRMTARHIAFGKWMALSIQILLLVTAILPYLVLRYFLGSVDVTGNLAVLAAQVLVSMLLTAVGVGLSASSSPFTRGLVRVGVVLGLWMGVASIMSRAVIGGMTGASMGLEWDLVLLGVFVMAVLTFSFVEYGASRIAPPAENHALYKRMPAVLLVCAFSLYGVTHGEMGAMILCLVMVVPVMVDALCEPLIGIPSVYRAGRRLGPLRWLFYPGWASGFLFTTVLLALVMTAMGFTDEIEPYETMVVGSVLFNTLLAPFVLIRLVPFLARRALPAFIFLQGLAFGGCMLMVFLEEIRLIANYIVAGYFWPMLGFFVIGEEGVDEMRLGLLNLVSLAYLVLIVWKIQRPLRQMNVLRQRAD